MKKLVLIIMVVAICLSFSACGASMSKSEMVPSATPAPAMGTMAPTMANGSGGDVVIGEYVKETDRIIIYSYSANVRVDDVEAAVEKVKSQIGDFGWVEYMNQYEERATVSIRVKAEEATTLVESLSNIGKVTRNSVSSDDVTSSYNNADQKTQILEIEQTRLIELLKNADVSESIEINRRLSEIEISLKNLYGEMKTYESLSEYSTVEIEFYTEAKVVGDGFFARLGDAMGDSFEIFQALLIFAISSAIYIIPIAVVVIIVVKKGKNKKGKNDSDEK